MRRPPNNGWDSASLVALCSTCLLIKITLIAHYTTPGNRTRNSKSGARARVFFQDCVILPGGTQSVKLKTLNETRITHHASRITHHATRNTQHAIKLWNDPYVAVEYQIPQNRQETLIVDPGIEHEPIVKWFSFKPHRTIRFRTLKSHARAIHCIDRYNFKLEICIKCMKFHQITSTDTIFKLEICMKIW